MLRRPDYGAVATEEGEVKGKQRQHVDVYEPTPFVFAPLACSAATWRGPVERVGLWCGESDSAFLLRNVLSPEECDEVIAQTETFGLQDCGYSRRVRVTDRVSVMAGPIGDLLFARARPFLLDVDVPERQKQPEGVPPGMLKGPWQPACLNPCLRACRYSPGGFFLPHHDGGYVVSDKHRSIKTFMVYLNDSFEGGPTTFYDETQKHYAPAVAEKAIYALRPTKGSCLVFNERITHDGGELLQGLKYILRTEVMYDHVTVEVQHEDGDSSDDDFCTEGQAIDEDLM